LLQTGRFGIELFMPVLCRTTAVISGGTTATWVGTTMVACSVVGPGGAKGEQRCETGKLKASTAKEPKRDEMKEQGR